MIWCQWIKNKGLPVTEGALLSDEIRHGKEGITSMTEFEGLHTLWVLVLCGYKLKTKYVKSSAWE